MLLEVGKPYKNKIVKMVTTKIEKKVVNRSIKVISMILTSIGTAKKAIEDTHFMIGDIGWK